MQLYDVVNLILILKRCTVAFVLVYMGQPVLLLHDLQTTSVPSVIILQIDSLPAALI